MLNGFINFYKKKGITSNKALCILKKHLIQNNIKTKVGHFGTLDPMAEGVLPIALGRATRLFNLSLDNKKEYQAVFEFGQQTDTLDVEGTVIAQDQKIVSQIEIEKYLPKLIGEMQQIPPKYSAKLVDGVRAYKLARQGVDFELKSKKVIIYDLKLIEQIEENKFSFHISCSGGTYIRAIVRDLAQLLGTYGTMTELVRTACGAFSIDNSVTEEELEQDILKHILPIDFLLTNYQKLIVTSKQKQLLLNGVKLKELELPTTDFCVYEGNNLLGIGNNNNGFLEVKPWLL